MLHDFKLRHNVSEIVANINRSCGDEYTSDRTVPRCFQTFRGIDQSLKDKKVKERVCSLDNKQLQAIVSELLRKTHDKVPKKCMRHFSNTL